MINTTTTTTTGQPNTSAIINWPHHPSVINNNDYKMQQMEENKSEGEWEREGERESGGKKPSTSTSVLQ